jgi:alkanesulfonate monooxygenase SsuD/methylene tetrahydromethanopterin reductase-like flavin-dependent oxidoreductase (luciferase family)
MKIGNFLFPESRDPAGDGAIIDETMREALLSEKLGVDTLWLAEHHFDGNCAYVDPITFAAALAAATQRIRIGFAVAQMSLHHPIRIAEQFSLIDHLSKGRLIIGLGHGTAYNIYEYQGYGIDHAEAQARFEEAEAIMRRAWTSEAFQHRGRFWNLDVPMLRPRPFSKPHPTLITAASGEATIVEIGRRGKPFLMNVQSNAETIRRVDLYRQAMRAQGNDDTEIEKNLEESWIWRNVFVAETDAEAERVGIPAFEAMQEHRAAMRKRIFAEQGATMPSHGPAVPPARTVVEHALIYGSPATVAEKMAQIKDIGVGGVIMAFRLGPMQYEVAANSLTLFMQLVSA